MNHSTGCYFRTAGNWFDFFSKPCSNSDNVQRAGHYCKIISLRVDFVICNFAVCFLSSFVQSTAGPKVHKPHGPLESPAGKPEHLWVMWVVKVLSDWFKSQTWEKTTAGPQTLKLLSWLLNHSTTSSRMNFRKKTVFKSLLEIRTKAFYVVNNLDL